MSRQARLDAPGVLHHVMALHAPAGVEADGMGLFSAGPFPEKLGDGGFPHFALGDAEDGLDNRIVRDVDRNAVELEEHQRGHSADTFIAVYKGMILNDMKEIRCGHFKEKDGVRSSHSGCLVVDCVCDGQAVESAIRGGAVSCDEPGECPPAHLSGRPGPAHLPPGAGGRHHPVCADLSSVLSDGQSLPPVDRDPEGQSLVGCEAYKRDVHAGLQPQAPKRGASLAGSLSGHSGGEGGASTGAEPVCGVESREGGGGGAGRAMAVEQLSGHGREGG